MELPRRIDKPWGHELWYAVTDLYVGKILRIGKGHRLSLQYHATKDESAYLLRGRLRLTAGPDADDLSTIELEPGAVWRNAPGTVHSIEALEDSEVLEVSTPEVDDVVRLEDDYGRAGTSSP